MHPRFALTLGMFGFATALVVAPFGVQLDIAPLNAKAALAAGNGHGNGGGRGNGHGKGRGNGQGAEDGLTATDESSPGRSGSAPGHGGLGNGQAVGHNDVSGVESLSAHQKGNLNAALNASPTAIQHASPNSIPGAVREAIQDAYQGSVDANATIDPNEVDLDALETALREYVSNKPVGEGVTASVVEHAEVPEPPAGP